MSNEVDIDGFVEFEATGFSRVADAYHRHIGSVTGRVADPLLDAAEVGAGTRVLDLATGPGYVAARAVARGASVLGLDLAPGVVELARRLHPALEFRQGDAHRLPLSAASFDAAVANFLVPHLADHARAAAELARVIVQGGRVALSTWDDPRRSLVPGALFLAVEHAGAAPAPDLPTGPPFFSYSDEATFANLLTGSGLIDVDVTGLKFTHRMPSAGALWHALLEGSIRSSAQVRGQTPEMQGRIRSAFDRIVADYQVDGELELPVSVKIASGRKPG